MIDFPAEIEACLSDITEVMGTTVTLRKTVQGAFTAATGARAVTTTDLSVKANRTDTRTEHTPAGDGGRQRMEIALYEIQLSLLTSLGSPVAGWQVIEGSTVREVIHVELDCDRKNVILTTRRTL